MVTDDINLAGSVGDGPVTGATVEVWSAQGRLIKTMLSDNTASFNSRLRVKRSNYPLLLKVRGGIDLVTAAEPDFQMLSVMTDRRSQDVNINPFSTLIVLIAQNLPGGISTGTIGTATAIVTGQLGFGLDLSLMPDPISSAITNDNIANLVKSSEAFGEMIRRTRDLVATTGRATSGDAVLAALAADLQDGHLDGVGANGADPQIAAIAKVVSGQVLVEALSNTLKVHGIIATLVIDQAIVTTRPLIGVEGLTQNVRTTGDMLQQTLTALAAARLLDPAAELAALEQTVSGIADGAFPVEIETVLPADASRSLDNALLLATTLDDMQLAAINSGVQASLADQGAVTPETTVLETTVPETTTPETTVTETTVPETTTPETTVTETTVPDTTTPETTVTETTVPDTTTPETTVTETTVPETTTVETTVTETTVPDTTTVDTTTPVTSDPVTVTPVNHAPVISGVPAGSVQAGTSYDFQPLATDADSGDVLTFSITGRPVWAVFDTATGRLSGTPGATAVATYRDIIIAVSDNTDTVALQPFSITVDPAPGTAGGSTVGTLDLAWTAPVTRADGSPISLSEIGGYRIHYGMTAGAYTNTVNVNDGSLQATTLGGMTPGTYHLVMTTIDTNGLASAYSPELVKVVY